MAHASPIAWGDRVFVATAVAEKEADLKVGLYGDIASANDRGSQQWRLLALDVKTGRIVWNVLAHEAPPKVQRHTKASHCNSTPATDGKRIAAIFGSEGLFCFDATDGRLVWKKDLGAMDAGYFASPTAQWGFGSSPVIYEGKVIVQCDVQRDSFLAAFDLADGRELWRTPRTDVTTWSTPAILHHGGETRIVVNGWREAAGYDFSSGKRLWWLDGGGDIPVPTPISAHGLVFLTSAHGAWRPLRAIRTGASGNITPTDPGATNEAIAWAHGRKGAYMQTPILVGDLLYSCTDSGILSCFDARTGAQHYSERLSMREQGFTASPVSDGRHLYFVSELGNVFVVPVEKEFRIAAQQPLPETCMATPAIADGALIFRTRSHVIALATGAKSDGMKLSNAATAEKEPPRVMLTKPDARLLGEWLGTLTVGAENLRVHFRIQEAAAGMRATLTSLDQGNAQVEVSRVGEHDGRVRFELNEMGAIFEGLWNATHDELTGEWQQSGRKLPLVLHRKASAAP